MLSLCKSHIQKDQTVCTKKHAAVIVEHRRHELLHGVVKNVTKVLGEEWQLYIFTHDPEFVAGLNARVFVLDRPNLDAEEYSQLLTSVEFWNLINEELVLIFQTDSFMFEHSCRSIMDYSEYPFIGGIYFYRWVELENGSFSGKITWQDASQEGNDVCDLPQAGFAICGGFSLRHRSVMLRCLHEISQDDVMRYRRQRGHVWPFENMAPFEDVYFSHAVEMLGFKMPSMEHCLNFCLNTPYKKLPKDPLAMHNINKDCWDWPLIHDVYYPFVASLLMPPVN